MSRRGRPKRATAELVKVENVEQPPSDVPLMVAMQPDAVESEMVEVQEVVVFTDSNAAGADGDEGPSSISHVEVTIDDVPVAAAIEEVKEDTVQEQEDEEEDEEDVSSGEKDPQEFPRAVRAVKPTYKKLYNQKIKEEPESKVVSSDEGSESEESLESSSSEEEAEVDENGDPRPQFRRTPKKREFAHRLQWRNRDMLEAMKSVDEKKMTIRGAAKKYIVPYSTLKDRVHGRVRHGTKPGVKTVLSPEEEEELVKYVRDMEASGFLLRHVDVRERAGELLRLNHGHNSPYKDCSPGHNWLAGFMKRHNGLELRRSSSRPVTPGSLTKQKQTLRKFYENVNQAYKKGRMTHRPDRIFVVSEMRIGTYNQHTLIIASSAEGKLLPPFVIFRGHRVKHLGSARSVYPEAFFTCSFDGQINEDIFLWWFRDHFLKKLPSSTHRPSTLFVSRHNNDLTIQLMQLAKEERCHVICMPPTVAHMLQPLDFDLLKELATMIEKRTKKWEEDNGGLIATHKVIAQILAKVWKKTTIGEEVPRRLDQSGIYPINASSINNDQILAAATKFREMEQMAPPVPPPSNSNLSGLNLLSALSSHEYAALDYLYTSGSQSKNFDQDSNSGEKSVGAEGVIQDGETSKETMNVIEEPEPFDDSLSIAADTTELTEVTVKREPQATVEESLLMQNLLKEQETLKEQAKARQRQSSNATILDRKSSVQTEIVAARENIDQINRAIDSILEKETTPVVTAPPQQKPRPRLVTVSSMPAPKSSKGPRPIKVVKVRLMRSPQASEDSTPGGKRRRTDEPSIQQVHAEIVEEEFVHETPTQRTRVRVPPVAGKHSIVVRPDDDDIEVTSVATRRQPSQQQPPQQDFQHITSIQEELPAHILQGDEIAPDGHHRIVQEEVVRSMPNVIIKTEQGVEANNMQQVCDVDQEVPGAQILEHVVEGNSFIQATEIGEPTQTGTPVFNVQQIIDENGQVIHILQEVVEPVRPQEIIVTSTGDDGTEEQYIIHDTSIGEVIQEVTCE